MTIRVLLIAGLVLVGTLFAIRVWPVREAELAVCAPSAEPVVVERSENLLLQYWLLPNHPSLASAVLPEAPSLRDFRERIAGDLDPDPYELLQRQLPHVDGGDADNVRLVLEGRAGALRPMSCLEGWLFATQTARGMEEGRTMYTHPTEFLSYVLERGDTLKVWYYTVDQPGVGALARLHRPVEEDIDAGWMVVRNIHNHNFFPDADAVLGGTVPSATDVGLLRAMRSSIGLSRASITNGFHTIDLDSADFDAFRAP